MNLVKYVYCIFIMLVYYLFNIVIYIYLQYDSLPDQYLEDISDARQTTAACMISDVNKDQITSMWSVNVENKLIGKHFIILLTNGSHHCSCLSLINRGIICRHYFQIMLHNPEAKFHVRTKIRILVENHFWLPVNLKLKLHPRLFNMIFHF